MRDDERFYAFQLYDDFLTFAVERKEWYAAATLAREAAAYSLKVGFVYDRHYLGRAAELWEATATHNEAAGGPPDLVGERAALGDRRRRAARRPRARRAPVRRARGAAAAREEARALPAARRRAAPTPSRSSPWPRPGSPSTCGRAGAYHDYSRTDLVEWELDGDPGGRARAPRRRAGRDERAGRARVSRCVPPSSRTRRGASAADPRAGVVLARALGRTGVYEVLRPLERLMEHAAPEVRAAVMAGAANVHHPRSLELVRRGLADPAPAVAEEALRCVRGVAHRDGVGALARLFHEATDARVRAGGARGDRRHADARGGPPAVGRRASRRRAPGRGRGAPQDLRGRRARARAAPRASRSRRASRAAAFERILTALAGPGR